MAVGAIVARIITQYSDKGSKAANRDITKLGKSFDDFSKKATRAFAIATAAVAAFAVKVGKDAVQAAMADQKSQILLANSLKNTTGATNAAIASVEQYISKLQLQVGIADDDLRPALSKLAAVTGDVAAAQQLLGLALDISAFSGADLGSATNALTRGLQGNFRSLQKLVPSIDAASIKSKDFAAILAEVQNATSGAAAARAGTLEFRLNILRIRFNEILETLGYALLPIIERFANTIQTKVLPQVEAWISANKDRLVVAFQTATDAAVKLITAAIAFTNWISNNMGLVKTMAGIIATMFVVGKVASFVTAIKTLAGAFVALRTAAAGAAIATAYATGGTSIIAATAALAAIGGATALYAGLKSAGNEVRQERASALANSSSSVSERGRAATRSMRTRTKAATSTFSINSILGSQNALVKAKQKELTLEQKINNQLRKKLGITLMTAEAEAMATAKAIELNLKRQSRIATSAPTVSLAAQGDGSASGGTSIMNSGAPQVNVSITTPFGTADDFAVKIQNDLGTLARRRGSRTASGINTGIYAE